MELKVFIDESIHFRTTTDEAESLQWDDYDHQSELSFRKTHENQWRRYFSKDLWNLTVPVAGQVSVGCWDPGADVGLLETSAVTTPLHITLQYKPTVRKAAVTEMIVKMFYLKELMLCDDKIQLLLNQWIYTWCYVYRWGQRTHGSNLNVEDRSTHHEYPLDPGGGLPLHRDRSHPPPSHPLHFLQVLNHIFNFKRLSIL